MGSKPLPFLIAAIALLIAACNSPNSPITGDPTPVGLQETKSTHNQLSDCPVTQLSEATFIPPEPWPPQPPGTDEFWFGDRGLWTALPQSGSLHQLVLGEKNFWWSEEFDVSEDETPDLKVTARRLDGDTADFQVSEATNAFHESINWAMLVGVDLASPGCWEFTGQYKDHQLSFVVWVPEE